MGILDNLFGSEDTSLEAVKSFFINDMEKKWKMHVEQNLQSTGKNVSSYLYAVQVIKFKAAPHDMEEAKKISRTKMAFGLVPMLQSKKLNIQLTNFLEVYIYFNKDDTIGFLSNIVDGNDEKLLNTIETDLKNAKSKYKTFIEDTHKKTFL